MKQDIQDQIDLCKTALCRAMGHLARMEVLFNQEEKINEGVDQEGEWKDERKK